MKNEMRMKKEKVRKNGYRFISTLPVLLEIQTRIQQDRQEPRNLRQKPTGCIQWTHGWRGAETLTTSAGTALPYSHVHYGCSNNSRNAL